MSTTSPRCNPVCCGNRSQTYTITKSVAPPPLTRRASLSEHISVYPLRTRHTTLDPPLGLVAHKTRTAQPPWHYTNTACSVLQLPLLALKVVAQATTPPGAHPFAALRLPGGVPPKPLPLVVVPLGSNPRPASFARTHTRTLAS
jgi:hypothetical protein